MIREAALKNSRLRSFITNSRSWQRRTNFGSEKTRLWLGSDWESKDEEHESVEFVKAVVEKALSDETEKTLDGIWFSSKKYCSSVRIIMDGAVRPGDKREGMRSEVTASKYGDGKWVIFVEDIEPDSNNWDIVIQMEFR